jgi:hypothetical protein
MPAKVVRALHLDDKASETCSRVGDPELLTQVVAVEFSTARMDLL